MLFTQTIEVGIPLSTVPDSLNFINCWEKTGHGIARKLTTMRIDAARKQNTGSVIATASEKQSQLLKSLGFFDTGEAIVFSDRPNTTFYAFQLDLRDDSQEPPNLSQVPKLTQAE